MTDKKKLEAISTYLTWDINNHEDAIDVLNRIWHVVEEDTIL